MADTLDLSAMRAVIFDADGTLWRGHEPLPGLVDLFVFLSKQGIASAVASNCTVETPAGYRQKLAAFGVADGPDEVLTATDATASYVLDRFGPGAAVFVIGENVLCQALAETGSRLLPDARHSADAVVVGGDRSLTYAKLKDAVLHIQRGAAFIGANPDILVPTEQGLVPEAGATLAAIQAATGTDPIIIGKPERPLFDLALARLGVTAVQTVMVGDRLETDILGGQEAGLKTILVTTGVDNEVTIAAKAIIPDAVFADLAALLRAWQAQA